MAKAIKKTTKKVATKPKSQPVVASDYAVVANYKSVVESLKGMPVVGRLLAELIGAFILAIAFIEMQGNPLFFGFALVGVVMFAGTVSGANPAMTVAAWITRKINWATALGYIAVQLIGASLAYLTLNTFLNASQAGSKAAALTAPTLFHAAAIVDGKEWYLFFAELMGAAILALGVAAAIRYRKENKVQAAFAVGLAAMIALYVAMSLTTTLLTEQGVTFSFLNPALAFAANGLAWKQWPLAIWVLAPVLGSVLGFVVYEFLRDINTNTAVEYHS